MMPAGVEDLDQAQKLLGSYGIISDLEMADRSTARASYHALLKVAGDWKLPTAVRSPMSSWAFKEAGTAIDDAGQIVQARQDMQGLLSDVSFNGTELQTRFEGAATGQDLSDLAGAAQQNVEAAKVLAQARDAEAAGRNPLQMIGLLGADLPSGLSRATDALRGVRSDEAKTAAQDVLDQVNGSTLGGVMRLAILLGLLVLAFVAFMLVQRIRRRHAVAPALGDAAAPVIEPPAGPAVEPPAVEPPDGPAA